jgi:long-chain acyl-CoA synthetase
MIQMSRAVPLACILFLVVWPARAAECIRVDMPDSVSVGGETLTLNGLGVRKATIFSVKVYVAGLYLAAKSGDGGAIVSGDQPRHLVLRFVRDVDVGDIREAWQEGFEKNAAAKLADLQARIDAMKALMSDFKEGDSLTFSYRPAAGTAILVNGDGKGTIEGSDFASALIAIWLADPPNQSLKDGLLGGGCG